MTDDIPQTIRLIVKARFRISPEGPMERKARKCLAEASAILKAVQAGDLPPDSLFLGRYAIHVADAEGSTLGIFLTAPELAHFLDVRTERAYNLVYMRIPERLGGPKAATSNAAKVHGKTIQIIPFIPSSGNFPTVEHILRYVSR